MSICTKCHGSPSNRARPLTELKMILIRTMIASTLPSLRSKCQELLAWNAASCLSVTKWLRSLKVNPSLDTLLSAVGQSGIGSSHLGFLNSGQTGHWSPVKSSGSWELGRSSDPLLSHSLICSCCVSSIHFLTNWQDGQWLWPPPSAGPDYRPNIHPSFACLLPFIAANMSLLPSSGQCLSNGGHWFIFLLYLQRSRLFISLHFYIEPNGQYVSACSFWHSSTSPFSEEDWRTGTRASWLPLSVAQAQ